MIFEKDVGEAIAILKAICYIIPPYQIVGLSYIQEQDEDSENAIKESIFEDEYGFDPSESLGVSPNKVKRG